MVVLRFFFGCFLCALLLASCAPAPVSQESSSQVEGSGEAVDDVPEDTGRAVRPGDLPADGPAEQSGLSEEDLGELKTFREPNPDWKARYEELYGYYLRRFSRPPVGIEVNLQLRSGRDLSGVVTEITDTEVFVEIDGGVVGYSADSLGPEAARAFFATSFAHDNAMAQGRKEYRLWQSYQASIASPPEEARTPTAPASAEPQRPETSPEEDRMFPVEEARRRALAPKNEGPQGRVWQVEEYIRENAVKPDSLRIKAWGKVQPHESGYKVRVQYSLQSAANLGISHEDMMFFMTSGGRVYRRAAVK
jgi:hypothetical protein